MTKHTSIAGAALLLDRGESQNTVCPRCFKSVDIGLSVGICIIDGRLYVIACHACLLTMDSLRLTPYEQQKGPFSS